MTLRLPHFDQAWVRAQVSLAISISYGQLSTPLSELTSFLIRRGVFEMANDLQQGEICSDQSLSNRRGLLPPHSTDCQIVKLYDPLEDVHGRDLGPFMADNMRK